MARSLPLDEMTVDEKLDALDRIWADLRSNPEQIPSPAWHKDVLESRAKQLSEGSTSLNDWDEVKKRLRELRS